MSGQLVGVQLRTKSRIRSQCMYVARSMQYWHAAGPAKNSALYPDQTLSSARTQQPMRPPDASAAALIGLLGGTAAVSAPVFRQAAEAPRQPLGDISNLGVRPNGRSEPRIAAAEPDPCIDAAWIALEPATCCHCPLPAAHARVEPKRPPCLRGFSAPLLLPIGL